MFATNILASSNIPDQTLLNQTANTFENISDDFFFCQQTFTGNTKACDDVKRGWDDKIMYSLLIIFSLLVKIQPAAWLQCAMTPQV